MEINQNYYYQNIINKLIKKQKWFQEVNNINRLPLLLTKKNSGICHYYLKATSFSLIYLLYHKTYEFGHHFDRNCHRVLNKEQLQQKRNENRYIVIIENLKKTILYNLKANIE